MKRLIIAATLLILPILCYSQVIWLEGSQDGIIDHTSERTVDGLVTTATVNHHSLFTLDRLQSSPLTMRSGGLTVFAVAHLTDREEQVLWKVHGSQADYLLHTNLRSANLSQGTFMNYALEASTSTQLSTYYTSESFGNIAQLSIGQAPQLATIPATGFTGQWAEFIAFDKALSPISIRIVESILALKYSLKVNASLDYLGVQGERLWERSAGEHQYNIGGLGRLDDLHFNQKISTTKLDQGSLTFSVASANNDNTFLLWGDDGKGLTFTSQNGRQVLDRTWLIRPIRINPSIVKMAIDHPALLETLPTDYDFYCAISSEEGNNLVRLDILDDQIVGYVNIGDHPTRLALIQAPRFWSYIDVVAGRCDQQVGGKIKGQIIGGQAPYTLVVTHTDGGVDEYEVNADTYDIAVEQGGQYTVDITDRDGQQWSGDIYMLYSDLPKPKIEDRYHLQDDLAIEAYSSLGHNLDITWHYRGESLATGNSYSPDNPGPYHLHVRHGDCLQVYPFEVIDSKTPILSSMVYPNPATSYRQYLSATLDKAAPYDIVVTDISGQVVIHQSYPEAQLIYQAFALDHGQYVVTLRVGKHVASHPLIVIR